MTLPTRHTRTRNKVFGDRYGDHIGKSRQALAAASVKSDEAAAALQSAEQDHWVSTEGLLCLLFTWMRTRRQVVVRRNINFLISLLFETCLTSDACDRIFDEELPGAIFTEACASTADDGVCTCIRDLWQPQMSGDASPQQRLFELMTKLMSAPACCRARSTAAVYLRRVAASIEASAHSWGDFEWHATNDAHLHSRSKRRRIDAHVRQYAIAGAQAQGKSTNTPNAVKQLSGVDASQGHRWVLKENSSMRAECLLRFNKVRSVAVAADASRIGKPAKDWLIGAIAGVDEYNGPACVFIPQDGTASNH